MVVDEGSLKIVIINFCKIFHLVACNWPGNKNDGKKIKIKNHFGYGRLTQTGNKMQVFCKVQSC